MKKAVSFVLIISVVFLLVFSLVACSKSEANLIIGTWTSDSPLMTANFENSILGASSIEIKEDGTLTFISAKDNSSHSDWTWTYDKQEKAYRFANANSTDIVYANISNDTLTSFYQREDNADNTKIVYKNVYFKRV